MGYLYHFRRACLACVRCGKRLAGRHLAQDARRRVATVAPYDVPHPRASDRVGARLLALASLEDAFERSRIDTPRERGHRAHAVLETP